MYTLLPFLFCLQLRAGVAYLHDSWVLHRPSQLPTSDSPSLPASFPQLLAGVSYLHDSWVLHRDLKPSNILLEQGRLKIAGGMAMHWGSACKQVQRLEPPKGLPCSTAVLWPICDCVLSCSRTMPADFGLARSVRQPLEPLWNNGVVVTIW